MTEAAGPSAEAPAAAPSAGALLRRAREARGLHVAALAASLKVPPRRLESLEQDRWDELPDPAFTRALAQSMCRALKTDPAPVLALLPRTDASRLEHVSGSINAPFRERSGSGEPGRGDLLSRPVVWVVVLLLVAAGAVLLWPQGLGLEPAATEPAGVAATETPLALPLPADAGAPELAAAGADATSSTIAGAGSEVEDPTGPAPATGAEAAPPAVSPDAPAADASRAGATTASPPVGNAATPLLQIHAVADSWVEVRDAAGQVLVSRTLAAGETLSLDPVLPARLTTGNVAGAEVRLRGERVDLSAQQRGNIARLELR